MVSFPERSMRRDTSRQITSNFQFRVRRGNAHHGQDGQHGQDGHHDCHGHPGRHGHYGHQGHHNYDDLGRDGHYGQDVHHGRDIHHGRGQTGQTKLLFKLDFPDNLHWAAFAILEVFRCYGHFALNDLQYPNFAFKVIIA